MAQNTKMNRAQNSIAYALLHELMDLEHRLYYKACYKGEDGKGYVDCVKPAYAYHVLLRNYCCDLFDSLNRVAGNANYFADIVWDCMYIWHTGKTVLKDGDDSTFTDVHFFNAVYHNWCEQMRDIEDTEAEVLRDADPSLNPFRNWFLLDDEQERIIARIEALSADQP